MTNKKRNTGLLLGQIRRTLGLRQVDIAEKSCIMRPNISRIEMGKYSPGIDVIERLEEALGIERVYIYKKNNIIMGRNSFILGATNVQEFYKIIRVLPCFSFVELSTDKQLVSAIWNDNYGELEYGSEDTELEAILSNLGWCNGDPEEYPAGAKCWWYIGEIESEL